MEATLTLESDMPNKYLEGSRKREGREKGGLNENSNNILYWWIYSGGNRIRRRCGMHYVSVCM